MVLSGGFVTICLKNDTYRFKKNKAFQSFKTKRINYCQAIVYPFCFGADVDTFEPNLSTDAKTTHTKAMVARS